MKTKGFLAVLSVGALLSRVGYGAWVFIRDITAEGSKPETTSKNIPVCYNANTGKRYVSLKKALDDASENQSVVAYVGTTITCEESITVKEKRTLILPFAGRHFLSTASGTNVTDNPLYKIEDANDETKWGNTLGDENTNNVKTYRSILLNMRSGADITVKGTLSLGGVHGTKGNNGYYSEINLGSGSSITCENGAVFNSFGYVKENAEDTKNPGNTQGWTRDNALDSERFVKMESGSKLYSYLAMYDAGAGGAITTLLAANQTPFSVYDFQAIQTYISFEAASVDENGKNVGCAELYCDALLTGPAGMKINKTIQAVSGESSKALFRLKTGYMSFENYNPSSTLYSSRTLGNGKTFLTFGGDSELGYLYFKEGSGSNSVELDTTKTFFPVNERFDVAIVGGHTFMTPNKMKFRGGSSLTIEEGSTFELNNQAIFYTGSASSYGNGKDAKFLVNGTLKLNGVGAIAGYAEHLSLTNKGLIDLSAVSSAASLTVQSPEGPTSKMVIDSFWGLKKGESDFKKAVFQPKQKYTSAVDGENYYWSGYFPESHTIKIVVDKGTIKNPVLSYNLEIAQSEDGSDATLVKSGNADSTDYSYLVNFNSFYRLSISRHESYTVKDKDGSVLPSYDFGAWKALDQDLTVTIVPREGMQVAVNYDKDPAKGNNEKWNSGTGHITYHVFESKTKGGTYYEVGSFMPKEYPTVSSNKTYVAKGYYFKINWTMDKGIYYQGTSRNALITTDPAVSGQVADWNPDKGKSFFRDKGKDSPAYRAEANYTFTVYWYSYF